MYINLYINFQKMHKRIRTFFSNFYNRVKALVPLSQISHPPSAVPITAGTYVCYCTWKRISSQTDVRVYFPITDRSVANLHPSGEYCARIHRFSRYSLARRTNRCLARRSVLHCKGAWLSSATRRGTSKIMKWHRSRDAKQSRRPAMSRKFWKVVSEKTGQWPIASARYDESE